MLDFGRACQPCVGPVPEKLSMAGHIVSSQLFVTVYALSVRASAPERTRSLTSTVPAAATYAA
jgi:hypothetical protein